jgi:AraC-like DNA-binding protein
MEILGNGWLARGSPTAQIAIMTATTPSSTVRRALLSQQVSRSQYFFLEMAPHRRIGCNLAFGGREHCNPDYGIDRGDYAYHVLEYVAEGAGDVVLDAARAELRPGCVFAYTPRTHVVLRNNAREPMLKYFFCLTGDDVGSRLAQAGLAPGTVRRLSGHAEIQSVVEDLVREGQRTGSLARTICQTLFELLLLKVADAAAWTIHGSTPALENFLRCKAYIDAEAASLRTLRDIARATGLEESSVCRLFRRHQGTSPYQYLLRRKMILAAEFLIEHGGLVKEAAQQVGYTDPYHFSRCFKAVHGVAPSELLRHKG